MSKYIVSDQYVTGEPALGQLVLALVADPKLWTLARYEGGGVYVAIKNNFTPINTPVEGYYVVSEG